MVIEESEIRGRVRDYLLANFLFGDSGAGLRDSDSFLEGGIVDSTGVLEIVEFVQDAFGLKVEDDEMVPENLDSIDNLIRFIRRKIPR